MKNIAKILNNLSDKLADFGLSDESISIANQAIDQNNWFTRNDICRSIKAIREQMLNSESISKWLSSYPALPCSSPRRVAIIMAGNIPLVGIFDLICTLAAGHEAWVKPSSKDRALMEYVISLLKSIEPTIPIYIYDDSAKYDATIATGGSSANMHFKERFKDTRCILRSNRHSIAVLSGSESADDMRLLAEDIYSYSGLGCRNVAMIIAPEDMEINVPTYSTTDKYRNSYMQTKALLDIRGESYEDNGSSVFVTSQNFPMSLSSISVWRYRSLDDVHRWIERHNDSLQCIVSRIIQHPQSVDFGQAQHPSLFNYADGTDTMKFLEFKD